MRTIRAVIVTVVVAGSSVLPGSDGAKKAYPARLQAALAEKLPGVTVNVTTDVKPRRTDFISLHRHIAIRGDIAIAENINTRPESTDSNVAI